MLGRRDLLIADLLNVASPCSGDFALSWPEALQRFEQERFAAVLILARADDCDLLADLQWMITRSPGTVFALVLNEHHEKVASAALKLGVREVRVLTDMSLPQDLADLAKALPQRFQTWRATGLQSSPSLWVGQSYQSVSIETQSIQVPGQAPLSADFDLYWEWLVSHVNSEVVLLSPDARSSLCAWADRVSGQEFLQDLSQLLKDARKPLLTSQDLPEKILGLGQESPENPGSYKGLPYNEAKRLAMEGFHKTYLDELLHSAEGNITVAAERAGLDRSNFKKIIRKYRKDL